MKISGSILVHMHTIFSNTEHPAVYIIPFQGSAHMDGQGLSLIKIQ